ncbi:MAG: hypothetical protein Q8L37_01425 [Candidatus Gottesmanbacteria bacterium]|nr:hypothetical protein [Candidatus Gottesmanbacteria bacterium]
MLHEALSPEMIGSALTNGATATYERPEGALLAMAAKPNLLHEARFQICLGGDPVPSPRTPVCILPQLEAMRTVQSMGIEPPNLYVFQSPLWQLYETKVDPRGVLLDEEEIFAGSAVAAELVFRFVERFYPDLLSRVKFAWLPYNEGALHLIGQWSGAVADKMPPAIKALAKKSGGSLVYALRHGLSYGVLAESEGLVIGTGGITERPFQEVVKIIAETYGENFSPILLQTYAGFGAAYYSRTGEPTLLDIAASGRYMLREPLKAVETHGEGEGRIRSRYSPLGSEVSQEMSSLQEKTDGRYLPFLAEFARGLVDDPRSQFTRSIATFLGSPERSYEEGVEEWMNYSFEFCQKSLGWPSDEEANSYD